MNRIVSAAKGVRNLAKYCANGWRWLAPAVLLAVVFTPALNASPIRGHLKNESVIWANSTDTYTELLRGGESTTVIVNGDGDTDLDLYIYNDRGQLVASDTDSTDYCVCRFFVTRSARYTIRVVNRGSVYNVYRIDMF